MARSALPFVSTWREVLKGRNWSCPRTRCSESPMLPSSFSARAPLMTRLLLVIGVAAILSRVPAGASPQFYPDDPLAREPESQDASKAQPYFQGSLFEMTTNLFVTADYKPSRRRAQNINTIDEVPDSNWFTNRIGSTRVTVGDLVSGVRSDVLPRRGNRRGGSCHEDLLGPRLQPGGIVPHDFRSGTRRLRSKGDAPPSFRRANTVHEG